MNDNLPESAEAERLEAAVKEYDQIVQAEPNNYQAWHVRGYILAQLNRYEESIASYDQALAINTDDTDSWYERGYVLSRIAQHEAAIASYDKAIELGKSSGETWYLRGNSCSAIGNLEAALESYETASKLQPESGKIWFAQGLMLFNLNRYGAARISLSRATRYSPNSARVWAFYGLALEKTGNVQKALESFDNTLAIEENAYFLTDRGRILRQLEQYDAALASYDRALELDPSYGDTWLCRGALLCDYLEQPQEALVCFQRALEISPDNPLGWYNHGNALRKLAQYEEAIASYEKAIEFQPDYDCALYERDWLAFLIQYQQGQTINNDLALKLVNWTIEAFLDQSIHEEDQIEQFLIGRGVQEIHSDDLIAFIPLAFGRVYLSEKAAMLSPEFIWIQRDTKEKYPVILAEQLIFQVAYDVAVHWMKERGQDPEFEYLATWSAEVDLIQKLLDKGDRLEDCTIYPSMGYSTCQPSQNLSSVQQTHRKDDPPSQSDEKPWWKRW